MLPEQIIERFEDVRRRMADAAKQSGRDPRDVRLVAVSKGRRAEELALLAQYWSRDERPVFGESYVQEADAKIPLVAELAGEICIDWHMVGHIQSRKAKDVAGKYSLIHSLDSLSLARNLQAKWRERAGRCGVTQPQEAPIPENVLVQVNIGREPQKSGVLPDKAEELLSGLLGMPGLKVSGLMCLPPAVEEPEMARPYFAGLRGLRGLLEDRLGMRLPVLSMGMSDDFEAAIKEGSNLVRVGSAIFGPRPEKPFLTASK